MIQIILNKFEKEKRVIELHLQGKIIRDCKRSPYAFQRYWKNKKHIKKTKHSIKGKTQN